MGIFGVFYVVCEGGIVVVICIFIVVVFCDVIGIFLVDCLYEVFFCSKLRKRICSFYFDVGEVVWFGVGGRVVSVV